mmetsp:Transcript_3506/g.9396  ORF Transcript_3506/g.9396 Transcript_3506/m.9396 type:complete len:301 (-) Transcript_3506:1884-2786(-)
MTTCTPLISRPRAATSVASRKDASFVRNISSDSKRAAWVMSPCSSAATGRPSRPNKILRRCARCLVRKKMMEGAPRKERAHMASSTASLCAAAAPLSLTTSWRSSFGTAAAASAAKRTGCLRESAISALTSSLKVALKSMVCRFLGAMRKISVTSSLNPISSSLSASSSTSTARSSSPTLCVLWRWSMRRPGVATTISGLRRSTLACTWELRPPTTKAALMSVCWAKVVIMECTCTASSRVGVSTNTYVAAICRGLWSSRSKHGSAKAAVLPLPVIADPHTSRPASASGTTAAWMGVGVV